MIDEAEKYGLQDVHAKLLLTLQAFDDLCRRKNIHYSLHGGALLGAERNGRLIPWDDDIDVSMVRSEYTKFENALEGEQSGCYLEKDVLWVPRFVYMCDGEAVHIDILVWDYISEKKLSQKLKINLLRAVQGMLKNEIDYSRFNLKEKLLLLVTHSIGALFTADFKYHLYYQIETKVFLGKKIFIHRSNDSFRGIKYILDKDYMSDYQVIKLENSYYMVNRRYKEFLIMEYGPNYLIPPPEKERIPAHSTLRNSITNNRRDSH